MNYTKIEIFYSLQYQLLSVSFDKKHYTISSGSSSAYKRKLIVNLYSDLITSAGFNREISQMRYATVINTIVVVKNIILSHRTGLFSHSAEITTFLLISIRRNK